MNLPTYLALLALGLACLLYDEQTRGPRGPGGFASLAIALLGYTAIAATYELL